MARCELETRLHLSLFSWCLTTHEKISPPPPPPVSTPSGEDSSANVSSNSNSFVEKFDGKSRDRQESHDEDGESLRHLSESGVIFPIIEATSGELWDGFQNLGSQLQSYQEDSINHELNRLLVSLISLNTQFSHILKISACNLEQTVDCETRIDS
jgi:hypothetical protein